MLRREMLRAMGLALLPGIAQRALAGVRMKITDIRPVNLRVVQHIGDIYGSFRKPPLKTSYNIGGGSYIEIHTDQDLVAIGPGEINAAALNNMKGLLIGRDPFDIENHAFNLYGRTGGAHLEIALWDLMGKA